MITFQKESFTDIMDELPPLFYEHWLEVGIYKKQIPLDIDWSRYQRMDNMGQIHMMTVRDDGIMVGYYIALVFTHLHYKTVKTAWSDLFYIHPEYRHGWTGYKLFKLTEKMLKAEGVRHNYIMTRVKFPINIIMKRLKYRIIERIFSKLL